MRIPAKTNNSVLIFKNFANKVKTDIINNKPINPKAFSCKLHDIGDVFIANNQQKDLNRLTQRLAEMLVSAKHNNLAGIAYSLLIKLNQNNIPLIETIATNALAIAKRQHDPIHIMARANDLNNIYQKLQPGSDKHIKALYEEKRALADICKNYSSAKNRYQTLSTEMKPLEKYEIMLAQIKTEIGKILQDKNPKLAIEELKGAYEILLKYGKGKTTKTISKLLSSLEKQI